MSRIRLVEGSVRDLNMVYIQMKTDFPAAERKSLAHIRQLMMKGRYRLLLAHDPERDADVGYAFVFEPAAPRVLWLDYMAIYPRCQGAGHGSALFTEIARLGESGLGVLLEVERADSRAKRLLRDQERRIAFYRRLGAEVLEVDYQLPTASGSLPLHLYFKPSPGVTSLRREEIQAAISAAFDYIHSDMPHRGAVLQSFIDTVTDHQVGQDGAGAGVPH